MTADNVAWLIVGIFLGVLLVVAELPGGRT